MIKKDNQIILKSILLFGMILAVLSIVLSLVLRSLHTGKSQEELMASITIEMWLWDSIRIGVLVWALIYLMRKLQQPRFWKLAVTAVGIVILNYYLFYFYELIDYYLVNPPSLKTQSDRIQAVLGLIEGNSATPPRYAPIDDLTGWQMIFGGPTGAISVDRVFLMLIFGSITMALWISAVVYFLFGKGRQRMQ